MNKRKLAIIFLSLMPIYLVPVNAMHICTGQEHHHGNCDGNMKGEGEQEDEREREEDSNAFQFEKANHLHCFQLQKETNPCIGCTATKLPAQQLAIVAVAFDLIPDSPGTTYHTVYHPPPNKEPPQALYRIRPPPFTCV